MLIVQYQLEKSAHTHWNLHFWQAEDDVLTGNMTKHIADKLPNSELIILPKVGHLWIMEHMKDVLKRLI